MDKLNNLCYLNLSWNQLSNLEGLEQLSNLSFLDLDRNEFTHIPNELLNLGKLGQLYIIDYIEVGITTSSPVAQLELRDGEVNLLPVRSYLLKCRDAM